MRNLVKGAGVAAISAALTGLLFATPAAAAPSGTGDARATIDKLEADGYKVILSKVGAGSIDKCDVEAVRPGRDVRHSWVQRGPTGNVNNPVLYTTVHVDLSC